MQHTLLGWSPHAQDARQPDSPLVQRGLILNERTGKTIKIGAATYNRLVLEGYTPNRAAGVLTPPGPPRSNGPGECSHLGQMSAVWHIASGWLICRSDCT